MIIYAVNVLTEVAISHSVWEWQSDKCNVKAAIFLACGGHGCLRAVPDVCVWRRQRSTEYRQDRRHVRAPLRRRSQWDVRTVSVQPSRTRYAFVADMRRMVRSCAYGDLEDSILRDRIVVGIRDDATRKKLLQVHRKLDLKQAVDICEAAEAATKQLKTISHTGRKFTRSTPRRPSHSTVRHVSAAATPSRTVSTDLRQQDCGSKITNCKLCAGQHDRGCCPAYGVQCNACGKKGHYAKRCYRRSGERDHDKIVNNLDATEPAVLSQQSGACKHIYSNLQLNGKTVRFLVDPGSTTNVIPLALANELHLTQPAVKALYSCWIILNSRSLALREQRYVTQRQCGPNYSNLL